MSTTPETLPKPSVLRKIAESYKGVRSTTKLLAAMLGYNTEGRTVHEINEFMLEWQKSYETGLSK